MSRIHRSPGVLVSLLALALTACSLCDDLKEVDKSTVWTDTVRRGSFEIEVRAPGELALEDGILTAQLRLPEVQAKDLKEGQAAKIDTRQGVLSGKVAGVDASGGGAGWARVDVRLDTEDLPAGVAPGAAVDVAIELDRVDDALYVGRPAARQDGNAVDSLFKVADDGLATRVPVRLGRRSAQFVEVLEGLEAGDNVILSDPSAFDDVEVFYLR